MMKKILIILIILFTLTNLVACLRNKSKEDVTFKESGFENKVSESKDIDTELEQDNLNNCTKIENETKGTNKQTKETETLTKKVKTTLEKTGNIKSSASIKRGATQTPITKATKIKASPTAGNKNSTAKSTTTQIPKRTTKASKTANSLRKTSSTTSHTHNYKAIYKTVTVPEQGHYETIIKTPAWTEEKPIMENVRYYYFPADGYKAYTQDEVGNHTAYLLDQGKSSQYVGKYEYVQTGTETINHPAVTEQIWIVDSPASTRQEVAYYQCSCGAFK